MEAEARRSELRDLLTASNLANAEHLHTLADGQKHPEVVKKLLASPERERLEKYAEQRLSMMADKEGRGNATAVFNTLIISEPLGSIVAIAFSSDEEAFATSPVGGNFAFRSYFNGNRADGDPLQPPSEYRATRTTHMSASFRSTATGVWKVGISSPVWSEMDLESDGETPRADAQPLGVIVLTINLGDFELLSRASEKESSESEEDPYSRFAALVDGRSGNQKGTLLQHPLLSRMDRETMKTVLMPQIDIPLLDRLQTDGGVFDYKDPAAKFEGGQIFEGTWLASIEQVSLPRVRGAEEGRTKSDLWILVQERSSSVAAPIRRLGSQLQRESFIELGTLLLVVVVLWYFVFRLGQATLTQKAIVGVDNGNSAPFQSTIESDL